jgi:hypothetical protein
MYSNLPSTVIQSEFWSLENCHYVIWWAGSTTVRISEVTAIKYRVKLYITLGKDNPALSQGALCVTHTHGLLHQHEKPHDIHFITHSVLWNDTNIYKIVHNHTPNLIFIQEKTNKMQQCIRIYYSLFIWSSTYFGQHTTHHREFKTALAASGFAYVRGC